MDNRRVHVPFRLAHKAWCLLFPYNLFVPSHSLSQPYISSELSDKVYAHDKMAGHYDPHQTDPRLRKDSTGQSKRERDEQLLKRPRLSEDTTSANDQNPNNAKTFTQVNTQNNTPVAVGNINKFM